MGCFPSKIPDKYTEEITAKKEPQKELQYPLDCPNGHKTTWKFIENSTICNICLQYSNKCFQCETCVNFVVCCKHVKHSHICKSAIDLLVYRKQACFTCKQLTYMFLTCQTCKYNECISCLPKKHSQLCENQEWKFQRSTTKTGSLQQIRKLDDEGRVLFRAYPYTKLSQDLYSTQLDEGICFQCKQKNLSCYNQCQNCKVRFCGKCDNRTAMFR